MNLPVTVFFGRSLREGTRQLRTYVIRLTLLLAFFATLASAQATSMMFGAPGLRLFDGIVSLNLVLICFAAPGYFASVITEEKEAGTLGLLKMAGLSPVSILLGKSTSQILGAIMLLLVQVPFTVLAVTLGGVSLEQVFAGYLAMLAFLVFMGNMALFCSVICRHSGRAAGLSVLFLLGFFAGPWIGRGLLGGLGVPRGGAVDQLVGGFFSRVTSASPFDWMSRVTQTGFSGPLVGFQFWSNLALAGGFFLLAWWAFDPFTREQVTAAPPRALMVRRVRMFTWLGAGRAWDNALAWKDYHFLSGGNVALLSRFILVGLIPAVILGVMRASGERTSHEEVGATILVVSLMCLGIELMLFSARLFGEERKWQTLSAIMSLPYSPGQIVWRKVVGHSLGLVPYVAWALLGAMLAGHGFAVVVGQALKEVGFWAGIAYGLLLLHLIVYTSLILKRGALLLAFGIWLVGGQFLMLPIGMLIVTGSANTMFTVMLVVVVVLILVVQRRIAKRLARAGELE